MTHLYIGTKEVTAWPQEKDGKPGYAVKYADGYISWSPEQAFTDAYRLAGGDNQSLTFGDAVHFLKAGRRVSREGWNGKGMWLYYVPANSYPAQTAAARGEFGELVPYRAYIAMVTVDHDVVPWLASQSDVLAEDWRVIE